MTTKIDPKKTALLLLDLQVGFLQRLPPSKSTSIIDNAATALTISRQHDVQIAYIRAALSESDISTIPSHNPVFAPFKTNTQLASAIHPSSPTTQIHPKLAPQEGDWVHRKIRYGAFMRAPSKALLDDFESKGIDTVVIGGVITSGAVLSAVRQLADLDFRVLVLEDCCADYDEELHRVLCEKVFPSQCTVVGSAKLKELF